MTDAEGMRSPVAKFGLNRFKFDKRSLPPSALHKRRNEKPYHEYIRKKVHVEIPANNGLHQACRSHYLPWLTRTAVTEELHLRIALLSSLKYVNPAALSSIDNQHTIKKPRFLYPVSEADQDVHRCGGSRAGLRPAAIHHEFPALEHGPVWRSPNQRS